MQTLKAVRRKWERMRVISKIRIRSLVAQSATEKILCLSQLISTVTASVTHVLGEFTYFVDPTAKFHFCQPCYNDFTGNETTMQDQNQTVVVKANLKKEEARRREQRRLGRVRKVQEMGASNLWIVQRQA